MTGAAGNSIFFRKYPRTPADTMIRMSTGEFWKLYTPQTASSRMVMDR
ncbi:MAG: hypothetical protein A4E73_01333 [Syntrophaceae bacterium PtaU1.Bin231]|nr:MAG: hypothetical protein A4E73_01333 [Syntrophaceae bacterium PtaU1.Bin231]